jgi:cystathionine beta-lyase/cystathionine gamma-synthase
MRFDTLAVHAGAPFTIDGAHPTAPPLVPASSYWYDSVDQLDRVLGDEEPGYSYARYASPTVTAFEEAVAALEGAPAAVGFASGMAAIHAAVRAYAPAPGSVLFASQDCYGGTFTLLNKTLTQEGVTVRFVDVFDVVGLARGMAEERPAALLLEVVSNPLERVADMERIFELGRTYGVPILVDSTFTTPYLMRPLAHGAACVIHSATKYLGGHGDVTGGVVACSSEEQAAALRNWRKFSGAVMGVLEAYLSLRGIRTLSLRVARQCTNAAAVAETLARALRGGAGFCHSRRGQASGDALPGRPEADPRRADDGRLLQSGALSGNRLTPRFDARAASRARHSRQRGALFGGYRGPGRHHRRSGSGAVGLSRRRGPFVSSRHRGVG